MGSPIIFSGSFAKLLTSGGVLQSNGSILQDSGPINYIKNGTAEVNTTGWATFADAAANIPVDMTGGSATNLTFSRSTSSPLDGSGQFSLVQANSTSLQGKGVSYDFTINAADKAQVLSVSFDFNASSTFVASNGVTAPLQDGTTSTNAGNSDIEVFIYDVTNSVLIPVNPNVITANGSNNFKFYGTFQASSSSTSYRLGFFVATTSANATGWTFLFDNVYVGPQVSSFSSNVTDWVAYTPTFTALGTVTAITAYSRRVGDNLEVKCSFTTGTAAASEGRMSLGFNGGNSNVTVDTSKIKGGGIIGYGLPNTNSSTFFSYSALAPTTNQTYVNFAAQTAANTGYTAGNGNIFFSTTAATFFMSVPILGWSSTSIASNSTDTRVVAALVTGDPASATSGNPIIVPTVTIDTHAAYSNSTGRYTCPVSGIYRVYGALQSASSATTLTVYKNAVSTSLAGNLDSNGEATFITAVSCVAGDLIDIRPGGTVDATNMTLNFERVSGPATITAADAVSARYFASATSISGSLATVSWTTKDYDSFGAMSAGTYTIPISGKYDVNAAILTTGTIALNNTLIIEIQKNGTVVSRTTQFAGGVVTDLKASVSDIISCVAGDTIRAQVSSSATSPSIVSSNFDNYFSIYRLGN